MSIKIRLARGGSKKRPYYPIVVANASSPRDGRFIEKVGTYNPMVAKDHPDRVRLNAERIQHWLSVGAQTTDRVARFLEMQGIVSASKQRQNLVKAQPKKRAQERLKALEAAKEAEQQS